MPPLTPTPLSDKTIREEVLEMNDKLGIAAVAALLGAGLLTTKSFNKTMRAETFMAAGQRAVAIRKNKIVADNDSGKENRQFVNLVLKSFWKVIAPNAHYNNQPVFEQGRKLKGKDADLFTQWLEKGYNPLRFKQPRDMFQTMQVLTEQAGFWATEKYKALLIPFRIKYTRIMQNIYDLFLLQGNQNYNWYQNNPAFDKLMEERWLLIGEILNKLPLGCYLLMYNPFKGGEKIEVTERTRDSYSTPPQNNRNYLGYEYGGGLARHGQENLDQMKDKNYPSLSISYRNQKSRYIKLDFSERDMKNFASWVLEHQTYLYGCVLQMNRFFNLNPEVVIFGYEGYPKHEYRYYATDWVSEGKNVRADMLFSYVMNREKANSAFVESDYEAKLKTAGAELEKIAKKIKRNISSADKSKEALQKEVTAHNEPLIYEKVKNIFSNYDQEDEQEKGQMVNSLANMIADNQISQYGKFNIIKGDFKRLAKKYGQGFEIEDISSISVPHAFLPNKIEITDFNIPQSLLDLAKQEAEEIAEFRVNAAKRTVKTKEAELAKVVKELNFAEGRQRKVQDRINRL
jgi:hypothetical protein